MPEKPLGKLGDILTEAALKKLDIVADEVSVTEAQSLKDVRSALSDAIYKAFGYEAYIEDWEKSYVYYAKNYDDKVYYKQKYSYDVKMKSITLLDTQIKVDRPWRKVREAVISRLVESKKADGSVWRVTLIQAGLSLNGYNYSSTLLRESAHLFEGAKAYMRTDAEHLKDSNKSLATMAGIHKNVRFNASEASLESDFHILDSNLRAKLLEAEAQGLLGDLGGLSIVASGTAKRKLVEGKVIHDVTALANVSSVDPVAVPSAGGQFISLAASKHKEGDTVVLEKMIEALKKHGDLYSQLDLSNIDESKVLVLFTEATIREAKPEVKVEVKPEVKVEVKPETKVDIAEAKTAAEKCFSDLEEKHEAKLQRQDLLATKLRESKLPDGGKTLVEKQFKGNDVFTAEDIDAEIASIRTIFAEASPTGKIAGFGDTITIGADQQAKYQKAMDGFFNGSDVDNIPRFRSFRESFKKVTNKYQMADDELSRSIFDAARYVDAVSDKVRARQLEVFAESLTTASWTQILGDSITRRMIAEYNMPGLSDWRKIVSDITPIKDFRTNRRMRYGWYGDLPVVAQSGAYLNLASPEDEEATYSIGKRGGLEDLTLEMIADDDVGAIRGIPRRLGQSAARTLYKAVFNIIVDNSAVTYDSVALFHNSHSNLGATALNATTLQAARIAMMGQQPYGGTTGDEMGIIPKYLLTPLDLEDTAFRLTVSPSVIGSTNEAATEPNIHSRYGLTPLTIPYWSDTNDWSVIGDPSQIATIEVGFYAGREEPELFVQDNPSIGTPFSNDVITYKIRHIWGIVVLDHRGMYKAVVA